MEEVARENETGYLPALKTKIERIEQYVPGLPYLGLPFNMNAGDGEGAVFRPLGTTVRRARLCKVSSSGADWKRWTISVIKMSKGGGSTERS